MSQSGQEQDEILFEFTRLDQTVRVCAVDTATGLEVVTIVPAHTSKDMAMRQARNKLRWRLQNEGRPESEAENGKTAPSRPPGRYL